LGDTFTDELAHLLEAIAVDYTFAPRGGTFEDGYWCDEVVAAILRSSESGREEMVEYR